MENGQKRAPSPPASGPKVQVKICGLTRVDEAVACAKAGAGAVGCVFYSKSPRCVTGETAREILRVLPEEVTCVGVFVDETYDGIMRLMSLTGITAVQLHGGEPPELVERLCRDGFFVVKALFADRHPGFGNAERYPASAFLVECGQGRLPGGNALPWQWSRAAELSERYPLILAGGLDPCNAAEALIAASPDAVDVSSGVEAAPGRKDIFKVEQFISAVSGAAARRRVF
ncbi:MAG: phosphoribosylanthranilate isomerase [Desulfobacteraceae bacterium]|jgi:phosphoribosylanthranilate isomerase|nr:MAG: phosphoribosylanthranilate isomerase [Desulfobacteraceae bacterium]